jgi:uncharacterized protein (TIGR02145 family)
MTPSILSFLLCFLFGSTEPQKKLSEPEFETVTIDGVTWTAQNANIKVLGATCVDSSCQEMLYSWEEAQLLDEQLLGWRLPTWKDWRKLELYFGSGLMEEYSSVTVGKEVKAALNIRSFPGYGNEEKLMFVNDQVAFWVKPKTELVDTDGKSFILTKHFYSPYSEKANQIMVFAGDIATAMKCSVRLVKEE